jgi:hypothetical protein
MVIARLVRSDRLESYLETEPPISNSTSGSVGYYSPGGLRSDSQLGFTLTCSWRCVVVVRMAEKQATEELSWRVCTGWRCYT